MDRHVDIKVSSGKHEAFIDFTLITYRVPSMHTNTVSTIFLQINSAKIGMNKKDIFFYLTLELSLSHYHKGNSSPKRWGLSSFHVSLS